MTTQQPDQNDQSAKQAAENEAEGLGWSAGRPTGGSNAGAGVGQGKDVAARVAAEDVTDKAPTRAVTARMADMDTSGLVEFHVTRPATVTPGERLGSGQNTERANRINQRDVLARKLNDEVKGGMAIVRWA